MAHRITLIPGDGIGPEVVEAARRAVEATGVAVEWDRQEMGAGAFARTGDPLPAATLASIRDERRRPQGAGRDARHERDAEREPGAPP